MNLHSHWSLARLPPTVGRCDASEKNQQCSLSGNPLCLCLHTRPSKCADKSRYLLAHQVQICWAPTTRLHLPRKQVAPVCACECVYNSHTPHIPSHTLAKYTSRGNVVTRARQTFGKCIEAWIFAKYASRGDSATSIHLAHSIAVITDMSVKSS